MNEGSPDALAKMLRMAGRAVSRAGLVHAYGHCSARLDDRSFLVTPSKPLGLIAADDPCLRVPLDGALPQGVLGEVRIHREIYRLRPDVNGIVRSMPPHVMTLAAHGESPKARHGFGSYFHPSPPFWDDVQLLRSDEKATALARTLGGAKAILMRGNGAVVAGASIQEAVVLTWYLEDMARVELAGRAAGLSDAPPLTEEDALARATWDGAILERMWMHLVAGEED